MPKTILEKTIETAVADFAMNIAGAVKNASLQDLMGLHEGAKPQKPGRNKPKAVAAPVKQKGKRLSRADKAALLDNLVAHLKKNPGIGCSTMAKTFKLPSGRIGIYLKELRAKGRVKSAGKKVGMTYFAE